MSWHRDKRVDQAFIALMDALCTWERNTGRNSRLLFIPGDNARDEDIIYLMDGKPVDTSAFVLLRQMKLMEDQIARRG